MKRSCCFRAELVRPCSRDPCAPYSWAYSAWEPCNATCDGGISARTAECRDQSGLPVVREFCGLLDPHYTTRICNSSPCISHRWKVKAQLLAVERLRPFCECSLETGGVLCSKGGWLGRMRRELHRQSP